MKEKEDGDFIGYLISQLASGPLILFLSQSKLYFAASGSAGGSYKPIFLLIMIIFTITG
jgi:hypothetical protein